MLSRRSLLGHLATALPAAVLPLAGAEAQGVPAPRSAPPPPRREPRPAPRRGYTWVPGHWNWTARRNWVWEPGHWEENRRGFTYAGPRWVLRRGQWVFEPGRWVRSW
ncbi:hypothetical protein NVS89_10670 [Ancylobacter sp. MQZ15Z-1]|uniref:YXWGXW repeat-containing protein n=1 Tax=Ancylobacter mangrovi TaxID=2972472 RepID=A0A9X2T260_9HYPH|nr:hypothetical protein [Ancylobacter mangrovi]MCS0495562.1 hypothetical protein [Ancylobacter mangrovi]